MVDVLGRGEGGAMRSIFPAPMPFTPGSTPSLTLFCFLFPIPQESILKSSLFLRSYIDMITAPIPFPISDDTSYQMGSINHLLTLPNQ